MMKVLRPFARLRINSTKDATRYRCPVHKKIYKEMSIEDSPKIKTSRHKIMAGRK